MSGFACPHCGGIETHDIGIGCIKIMRRRVERCEKRLDKLCTTQVDAAPERDMPEPKPGQVWCGADGEPYLLFCEKKSHSVRGRRVFEAVCLPDGQKDVLQFGLGLTWYYVCDGAVPASEVKP